MERKVLPTSRGTHSSWFFQGYLHLLDGCKPVQEHHTNESPMKLLDNADKQAQF